MSQKNHKIMTVGFIVAAAMVFWVVKVLMSTLAIGIGSVAQFQDEFWFKDLIPVGIGFIVFLYLQFNSKIKAWADEGISETGKVVWPSKADTKSMTIATCIMLLVSGVVLGLFDITATKLVNVLLAM